MSYLFDEPPEFYHCVEEMRCSHDIDGDMLDGSFSVRRREGDSRMWIVIDQDGEYAAGPFEAEQEANDASGDIEARAEELRGEQEDEMWRDRW